MAEKTITRLVRLSALQVGSLQPSELEYALAYELEPESGIPAAQAAAVWRELESPDAAVKVYEVTVSRRSPRLADSGNSSFAARHLDRLGANSDGGASFAAHRWLLILPVVAILAAIVCAADFAILKRRNASLRGAIAAQEPLDGELKRLQAQERAARDEARAIEEAREAAERAQQRVETLRAAFPGALEALAAVLGSAKSSATIVSFSSPRPFALHVNAVATSAAAAADTLAELAAAAAQRGWTLSPGDISSAPDGLTAAFSFQLEFPSR